MKLEIVKSGIFLSKPYNNDNVVKTTVIVKPKKSNREVIQCQSK